MTTNEMKLYFQKPFSFGVFFGMGLIVAPVVLALIIVAVTMLATISGVAVTAVVANVVSPSAKSVRVDRPAVVAPEPVVAPRPVVAPKPVSVPEPVTKAVKTEQAKPMDIPWAAIIFGTIGVAVAGGGGTYAYYLMQKG